jgi:hypothetical protein
MKLVGVQQLVKKRSSRLDELSLPAAPVAKEQPRYLPTSAAAAEIGVCGRTLHNWSERGLIDPPRRIGRNWMWPMHAIHARLAAAEKGGTV